MKFIFGILVLYFYIIKTRRAVPSLYLWYSLKAYFSFFLRSRYTPPAAARPVQSITPASRARFASSPVRMMPPLPRVLRLVMVDVLTRKPAGV